MKKYIYYTKQGKFETDEHNKIPWNELHSPDENTPALIYSDGTKGWFYEGKIHRLSGPAVIHNDGKKEFWLNGIKYEFENWLKMHPNQDISFQTKMKLKYM